MCKNHSRTWWSWWNEIESFGDFTYTRIIPVTFFSFFFSLSCVLSNVSCISYTDLASVVGDTIKKQLQDLKDNQVCFTLFLAFLLLTICFQVCYPFFADNNVWCLESIKCLKEFWMLVSWSLVFLHFVSKGSLHTLRMPKNTRETI